MARAALAAGSIVLITAGDIYVARFIAGALLLAFIGWQAARRVIRSRTVPEQLVGAWTFANAALLTIGHLLSLIGLFGSAPAWLASLAACAVLARFLGPSDVAARLRWDAPDWRRTSPALRVLGAVLLCNLAIAAFLVVFTGPNVGDSFTVYLPQSIRYVEDGSLFLFSTSLDYLPYAYQALIAVELLLLRSDAAVAPTSFVAGLLTSLAMYVIARGFGWRHTGAVIVAALPWTMAQFFTSASATRHDLFETCWVLAAVAFIRRGAVAGRRGHLAAGAAATGLAVATKTTFAFVAPGLALVWLAAFLRLRRRWTPREIVEAAAGCAALIGILGAPYVVRNAVVQEYLFAPPDMQEFVAGSSTSPSGIARRLAFNGAMYSYLLLRPPFLMSYEASRQLDDRFAQAMQWLGFELPDDTLVFPGTRRWDMLEAHAKWPYHNDFASFGAALPLVVVPGLLAFLIRRKRIGPPATYVTLALAVALSYALAMFLALKYNTSTQRYLLTPVLMLTLALPALGAALPARLGRPVFAAVGLIVVAEMSWAIRHNILVPIPTVLQAPRDEQYLLHHLWDPPREYTFRAARELEARYPPGRYPDLWIHVSATGNPGTLQLAFMRPLFQRRTHEWVSAQPPRGLPGLLISQDASLVDQLVSRGMATADRLSENTWALVPVP